MSAYKKYPNLPWWLVNMDHSTLTPAEKEVLDLDYYCRGHGNRLSHRNAAKKLHRSKKTVYRARQRLEKLLLRCSEIAIGSCKVGHPIRYKNQTDWRAELRAQNVSPRVDKMSTRCYVSKRLTQLRVKRASIQESEPPVAKEKFTHPPTPPSRGAGGSVWEARRSHPQWKKYLTWGCGLRKSRVDAEAYADAKFLEWLKAEEARKKSSCQKSEDQSADSSA